MHKKQKFARAWIIMASSWMNKYDLCIYAVSTNKRNRFLYQHSNAGIFSSMWHFKRFVHIHFVSQWRQSYPLAFGSHWTKAAITIIFIFHFATRNHHEYLSIVSKKENPHRKCFSYFVASAHFSFDLCKFEKKKKICMGDHTYTDYNAWAQKTIDQVKQKTEQIFIRILLYHFRFIFFFISFCERHFIRRSAYFLCRSMLYVLCAMCIVKSCGDNKHISFFSFISF